MISKYKNEEDGYFLQGSMFYVTLRHGDKASTDELRPIIDRTTHPRTKSTINCIYFYVINLLSK